jgi:hypothetical protein
VRLAIFGGSERSLAQSGAAPDLRAMIEDTREDMLA